MGSPRRRRPAVVYTLQVALLMGVAYPALLLGSQALLSGERSPAARLLLSAAPALPVLLTGVALLRFVLRADELQRRIHLQAFAAGFFAVLGVALTAGFLEVGGQPPISAWAFVVAGACVWLIALVTLNLRYR
jgi:hypothetical protein